MCTRKKLLGALPLAGALPLVTELPYLCSVWRNSPLERYNWLFLLFALLGSLATVLVLRPKFPAVRLDWQGLGATGLGALLLLVALFLHIHAGVTLAALLLAWGLAWLTRGWSYAWKFLPLLALGAMGVPNVLYWMDFFLGRLMPTNQAVHLALGGACLLGWCILLRLDRCPAVSSFLFALLVVAGLGVAMMQTEQDEHSAPRLLALAPDAFPRYLGREMPLSENDRRFFEENLCRRWCFAPENPSDSLIDLLAVEHIASVHSIHPARHCLRAGGFEILSARIQNVAPEGQKPFHVEEIQVADRSGRRRYGWVWYSNAEFSTPSYLLFRLKWRFNASEWNAYQLFMDAEDASLGKQTLQGFLFGAPTQPE